MVFERTAFSRLQIISVIILATAAVLSSAFVGDSDNLLRVYFLDVGQGDAVLISYQDKHILIDGGPDRSVVNRLSEALPFSERELDMVIATHPDADHIGGLIDVMKRYGVERVLEPGIPCDTKLCGVWDDAKALEGAPVYGASLGQKLVLGADTALYILYPFAPVAYEAVTDKNAYSIAALLRHGETSFLFTGDLERSGELKLVYGNVALDVDVLKLGHHGSNTSSTEAFLQATSPAAAVISAGENNRYGHPSAEILARLESFAIPYYRTDEQGTIEIVSDGTSIAVSYSGRN